MTVAETLTQKVKQLPLNQQLEVLNYVESLEQKEKSHIRHDPEGILADRPSNLSLEDFARTRQEAWHKFPRELPQ